VLATGGDDLLASPLDLGIRHVTGMPISMDRSLEPTSRQSMPGTAAIASAFSIPAAGEERDSDKRTMGSMIAGTS
jgi:hypothetical protein